MTNMNEIGRNRFKAKEDGVFWGVWDNMNRKWHQKNLIRKEAFASAALLNNRHAKRTK